MEKERLAASQPLPHLEENMEHLETIKEYGNFLFQVPTCGHFEVVWSQVERWEAPNSSL